MRGFPSELATLRYFFAEVLEFHLTLYRLRLLSILVFTLKFYESKKLQRGEIFVARGVSPIAVRLSV